MPGPETVTGDDDDWLNLDDDSPLTLKPLKTRPSDEPPADDELPDLGDFGGDGRTADEDLFGDLPAIPPAPKSRTGTAAPAPAATSVEYLQNYRVRCKICESPTDVTADQAGETIQCHDCHSKIVVPPPPKVKKKHQFDLEKAEAFTFSEPAASERPADPFMKSARDLLDYAEREEAEEEPENYDTPSVAAWLGDVFGIFKDPSTVMYAVIFSIFGGGAAALMITTAAMPIISLTLIVACFIISCLVVACGFTIMEAVANDVDEITDWPQFLDPGGWLGPIGICAAASALVSAPAWFLGLTMFGNSLVTVFLLMLMIYLLFPFVLLSMLDMQSIFAPFSPEVARSVTTCKDTWAGFYFTAGVLFGLLFLAFVSLSLVESAVGIFVAVALTVVAVFLYFAMLGRLAFSIGQAVNEPPMENDIEHTRRNKTEQPS